MQAYSQAFNNAIRSTDREIRGYLEFNADSTKRMYGSDGLISFVCHREMQDAERFCVGSTAADYCEASFFNSGIPSGVSLANSFFVPWVGVKVTTGDSDSDLEPVPYQSIDAPGVLSNVDFTGVPDGCNATFRVGSSYYEGTFDHANGISVTSDTMTYNIYPSNGEWYFEALDGLSPIVGTFSVGLTAPAFEYKAQGRYYVTEISREKETTAIVGYSEIAYKMNVPYVPTVTKTSQGYKILDILNDIIDQTGCNNGQHYTGYNYYIPEIVEGTCAQQFTWLVCGTRTSASNMVTGAGASMSGTQIGYRRWNRDTYTSYPAITDDQIYMDGLKLGDTFTITSYTTGTTDNPIVCGSGVGPNNPNPYITSANANSIFNDINGESYTPMTLHFRGDPCIALFDTLKVTTGGTDYKCVVMRITSTFNGGFEQTIDCWGDSEAYYEMSYSPMEAKIQTNNTLIKDIAQAIETARGGVISQILDADGTWSELVIANSQDLSTATSVWRFNINGLAHSNRYSGGTYTFALDDQGRIVATLIQTGILQDALGKNSWNLDTGAFTITDGSINITTSASSTDVIQLTYGAYSWYASPLRLNLTATNGTFGTYSTTLAGNMGAFSITGRAVGESTSYNLLNFAGSLGQLEIRGTSANGKIILGKTKSSSAISQWDDSGLTFYNSSGTQTALYPSGGFTYYGGTAITSNVPSGTSTAVRSLTLQAGRYIIWAQTAWGENATGRRNACIGTESTNVNAGAAWAFQGASPAGQTRQSLSAYVTPATATTYYLVLYQNSGSTLAMSAYGLYAIKLP